MHLARPFGTHEHLGEKIKYMRMVREGRIVLLMYWGRKSLVRSRWHIMADVLGVAKSSESKTHIMYRANLSFRQLERYLEHLLDLGFLRISEERQSKVKKLFVTTDRGLAFLKAYHSVEGVFEEKNRF